LEQLKTVKKLEITEGATHLLENSASLEQVAKLAVEWFNIYLDQ